LLIVFICIKQEKQQTTTMDGAYNMTLEEIRSKSDGPTLILLGALMVISYLASLFGDDFDR